MNPASAEPRAAGRILIVDDEPDTCANLSDILADRGYEVDTATSGETALELVRRRRYDVALLDFKMPGMDGLTLYRKLKELQADTVAIVVTAYASSVSLSYALEAGAWKVVSKPVEFPALLSLIDQALEQPLVLIVDDDHDLCDNLWDLLHERDVRVCLAHDEEAAKQMLRWQDYGVVLIDMKLPRGDGLGVFRLVREANPKARTVLITGHRGETEEQIARLIEEGADSVCYKPFDVGKLLKTVQDLAAKTP
jgi:two-component system, NtrC family, response regulator HydG